MSKILYPIFKLPNENDEENETVPTWIKWWMINNYKKRNWVLSEILTGNPLTLENSVKTKFYLPPLPRGNSEQDGEPSPANEVPIQNVTGDVEVLVQNKNIFDINAFVEEASSSLTITQQNDEIIVRRKSGSIYNYPVNCKENSSYTISFLMKNAYSDYYIYFIYDDGSSTNIKSTTELTEYTKITKTSTENKTLKYIQFQLFNWNNAIYLKDIQLENNTIETTYTPHQEQTFTFPLGTQRMYLGDYLADDGIHHVRGVMTFDGTENWYDYTPTYEGYYTGYTSKHFGRSGNFEEDILCNYFENLGLGSPNPTLKGTMYATYIKVPNSIATNMNELKTWLGTHNVEVEYPLATETVTPYTTEQQEVYNAIKQAISYEEQTNISGTSSEAEPFFEVQYYMINESEGE